MVLNRRHGRIFFGGFLLLLLLALGWGRYSLTPGQVLDVLLVLSSDEVAKNIIFNLRRPRLLAALLTMSLPQLVQRSTIVLVLAGGKNARPEAKNLAVISLEEIIRVNPQIIIGSSGNRSFEAIRKIKDSPEWARTAPKRRCKFSGPPSCSTRKIQGHRPGSQNPGLLQEVRQL